MMFLTMFLMPVMMTRILVLTEKALSRGAASLRGWVLLRTLSLAEKLL